MPKFKVSRSKDDQSLIVTFEDIVHSEEQSERFADILTLAASVINAESLLSSAMSELPINRRKAILAVQMLQDFHVAKAVELTEAALALTAGEEKASNIGFPEFDDDAVEGMFD